MRFYHLLILAVVFFSCKSNEKSTLEKAWLYNDDLSKDQQMEDIFKYGGAAEYGFTGASFMNLQPGGKFTSNFNVFDYGDWKMQDSTIILTNHSKGKLVLDVKKLDSKQMVCLNKSNHKVYRFNGFPNSFASDAESPFSIANNAWRVKAGHKETDEEIRARLKNHFRWWEKYFAWGLNNKMQVIDIRSTASVLDMYANGFELKYYDQQFPNGETFFMTQPTVGGLMKLSTTCCIKRTSTGLKPRIVSKVLFPLLNSCSNGWILIPALICPQRTHQIA